MKLVFATHNKNKFNEVQRLLPKHIELLSLDDIKSFEAIPETADTLEGNARIKADYVTQNFGYPCFADDTGLLVRALNGAPGVFSARYAGPNANANANMKKLLEALKGKQDRSAQFETVIALNLKTETKLFRASAPGKIITERKGVEGFGYDPIFMPDGFDKTFAELPIEVKNKISHRGKAISQLLTYLNTL